MEAAGATGVATTETVPSSSRKAAAAVAAATGAVQTTGVTETSSPHTGAAVAAATRVPAASENTCRNICKDGFGFCSICGLSSEFKKMRNSWMIIQLCVNDCTCFPVNV